jgi:hypothetical protein
VSDELPAPGARQLAELFHDRYEQLAPKFGYVTRMETRAFDPNSTNGRLMIAVCDEILTWLDLKVTATEIERLTRDWDEARVARDLITDEARVEIDRLREDLETQRKIDLQIIAEKNRLRAALERIIKENSDIYDTAGTIAREALQAAPSSETTAAPEALPVGRACRVCGAPLEAGMHWNCPIDKR